jgi:hypothetical protein
MTLSTRLWKLPKSTSKKQNIYNILLINMTLSCQIKQIYISLASCVYWITLVKHNFKSVHVSNLFWSREYNSAKEICKYTSFSKVGGNYPLDLKIIWSSVLRVIECLMLTQQFFSYIIARTSKFSMRDDRFTLY